MLQKIGCKPKHCYSCRERESDRNAKEALQFSFTVSLWKWWSSAAAVSLANLQCSSALWEISVLKSKGTHPIKWQEASNKPAQEQHGESKKGGKER